MYIHTYTKKKNLINVLGCLPRGPNDLKDNENVYRSDWLGCWFHLLQEVYKDIADKWLNMGLSSLTKDTDTHFKN